MNGFPYHVLLIEDDDDHALLIEKQIRRIAVVEKLTRANDGVEAIDLLARGRCTPDLVLLDLNLPGLNGHEVLETIRSTEIICNVPVVVVTSSTNDDDAVRALEHDVMDVVVKPVPGERIGEIIHRSLACAGPFRPDVGEERP